MIRLKWQSTEIGPLGEIFNRYLLIVGIGIVDPLVSVVLCHLDKNRKHFQSRLDNRITAIGIKARNRNKGPGCIGTRGIQGNRTGKGFVTVSQLLLLC